MNTVTRLPVIQIGDAAAIRIPQIWLDRLSPDHEVEIVMEEDRLIIRPARRPDAPYQPVSQANHPPALRVSEDSVREDDAWDL